MYIKDYFSIRDIFMESSLRSSEVKGVTPMMGELSTGK